MQQSLKPFSRFLPTSLLAGIAVLGVAGSQPATPIPVDPELSGIIERTLERATWAADTEFDVYFHARVLFRTTRQNTTTRWSEFELAD